MIILGIIGLIIILYLYFIIEGLKIFAIGALLFLLIRIIISIVNRSKNTKKIQNNKIKLGINEDTDYDIMVGHVNRVNWAYGITAEFNDYIDEDNKSKIADLIRIASSSRLRYTESYRRLLIPYENKKAENMLYLGLTEGEDDLYQELITTIIERNKQVYNRLDEVYGVIGGSNQRTIMLNDARIMLKEVRENG